MDTFKKYGFAVVEREMHDREEDDYEDEMFFCLLPIPISCTDQSMSVGEEVDAVCVVGKNTEWFCCGQNCYEQRLLNQKEESELFKVEDN